MTTGGKILIVDDEPINLMMLKGLLGKDYEIITATDGPEALAAARMEAPDLILLDVVMPGMDGHGVCARLKADPKTRDIPVIFVTAKDDENDESLGLEQGAADYISKPIKPVIVRARVRTQMERRQHLAELQRAYAVIRSQKERMEQELDLARQIQLSMLPADSPTLTDHPAYRVHAYMRPAREVGGDLYDFFLSGPRKLFFCVGDVSGKGVPASLFMAITKALIRSRSGDDACCSSILAHINDEIESSQDGGIFVTVFLAVLDLDTGDLGYTNAGHNPPYILRADGALQCLDDHTGSALGIIRGAPYRRGHDRLAPGDSILIYSDGITEARDTQRRMYGEPRLRQLLQSESFPSPQRLIERVSTDVQSFVQGAEQSDDITLLALRYEGKNNS